MTANELKLWLYRYVKQDASHFAGRMWEVAGDEYIPELVSALEVLADHILALPDDDPRLAQLATAYTRSGRRLEDMPYGGNLQSRLTSFRLEQDPDEWVREYVDSELWGLRPPPAIS
jgi:hypothetical protein